jgi:hypothetical protein
MLPNTYFQGHHFYLSIYFPLLFICHFHYGDHLVQILKWTQAWKYFIIWGQSWEIFWWIGWSSKLFNDIIYNYKDDYDNKTFRELKIFLVWYPVVKKTEAKRLFFYINPERQKYNCTEIQVLPLCGCVFFSFAPENLLHPLLLGHSECSGQCLGLGQIQ